MFNRVVSIFVMAVVLCMGTYADVVPIDLGSIRVNTPMYTAEGIDNLVSNVVAGIERDNITDGTNTIDAAGGVYVKRGVGDDWTLVSGNYNTNPPLWITKDDKEKDVEKTGWYGYGLDVGYQFLSEDFYAMGITGIVKGRMYDSDTGNMVYHVSTNTWRRTNTEFQLIGRLALTNDIQKVFQLSTNAANNLITAATNGLLRTEQDPSFTVWTNGMNFAAGKSAQANATGATALGYGARVDNKYGVAVGNGIVQADYGIAIGIASTASGEYDTALGQRINMNGPYGAAVGAYSSVIGSYGSALGPHSYAAFKATALGNNSYAPSQSFGTTYDPEHFYFTSSNNTTVSKRGINKKSLQAYLNERVATNAIANVAMSGAYSDLTGAPTNVSVFSNDAGYVTESVTNGLATKAELGDYLPLSGGTLTGDLAVGEEHTASRRLTIAADNGATGITMTGGTSTGNGSIVAIGGSRNRGGTLIVNMGLNYGGRINVLGGLENGRGGSISVTGNGASISAKGTNASIKKGDDEVATESYVDTKVSSAVADKVTSSDVATALEPYLKKSGGTVTGNLTLEVGSGGSSPTLEVSGVSSSGIKLNAEYGGKITVGAGSNGGGQIVLGDSSVTGGPEAEVTIGTVKVRATLAAVSGKADEAYSAAEDMVNAVNSLAGTVGTHTRDTTNPHKVTAAQVGAVQFVEDVNSNKTAVTIGGRSSIGTVGQYSLANGQFVNASGYNSHAEGEGTTASGQFSHSEGQGTTASGYFSHAEGYGSTASGHFSHAEGYESQTSEGHQYSFAWNGDTSVINRYSSHGSGTFNINPAGGMIGFYIGEQNLIEALSAAITSNGYYEADITYYGEDESATVVGHTKTPSLRKAVEEVAVESVLKPSDPLCGWSLPEYVSALSKYVYDEKEQCCYRREATNSYIILVAVTNIDLTAVGNIAVLKAYEDSLAIRKPPEVSVCYTVGYEEENNKFRIDGTDFILEGEYLNDASVTVTYEVSGESKTEAIQPSLVHPSSNLIRISAQALNNARSAILGSTIMFTIQTAYGRTTAIATVANTSE